jgi:Lecithin:cholesterol acyltransferase
MSYGSVRDDEFTRRLDAEIAAFAADYETGQPTIILFPGGMGSQLYHYDQTYPTLPVLNGSLLWVACDFFAAGAEKVWLNNDGSDANHQYVVADDAIHFSVIQPYWWFRWWCSQRHVNLIVFGYDWRRSAQEAATYFVGTFMPHLDQAILTKTGAQLQNFYLVGHSAGGMAVKLILNDATNTYVQRMTRAITVASPFYGYAGQIHRFLTGVLQLNWTLAEPAHQNRRMAEIIATMPGGYEYLYLDHQTYLDNYAGFIGANEHPDYRLPNYPCMDADVSATPADPYDPTSAVQKVRYPVAQAGLPLAQLLSDGLQVSKDVAKPLDAGVAAKFYNIRGVQTRSLGTVKRKNTAVSSTWKGIDPANYNPDAAIPPKLMVDTLGYGDGTQPAWSTRLLQLQEDAYNAATDRHVITLANDWVDHMFMMNEWAVQNAIGKLLLFPAMRMAVPVEQAPKPASQAKFNAFLKDLELAQKRKKRTPAEQLEYIRKKYSQAELDRLALRGYADLLKTPTQLETSPPRKRPKPKNKVARQYGKSD